MQGDASCRANQTMTEVRISETHLATFIVADGDVKTVTKWWLRLEGALPRKPTCQVVRFRCSSNHQEKSVLAEYGAPECKWP